VMSGPLVRSSYHAGELCGPGPRDGYTQERAVEIDRS
jgi:hypothetical protein